ncbi:MAG: exosortase [Deltaproteobacteria bacterium]|nr:exosortase [Deltaproteobacteria bacterium]MCL4872570.1 exosortase [bacterium]
MSMTMEGRMAGETPGAGARTRVAGITFFSAGIAAAFSEHLARLYDLAMDSELYSHITLIPFLTAYLLYLKRKEVLSAAAYGPMYGVPVLLAGAAIFIAGRSVFTDGGSFHLAAMVLSAVVFWIGGFVTVFGGPAARAALFPLLFLLFAVPVPEAALDPLIKFLQRGSAEAAWFFLSASGSPVEREGLFFHLPGLTVEVARECSGIRSSLVLFIAGVTASNMFLKTWPGRLAFVAAVFPIAVVKNGIRITVLTLAGYHIDERMLYGTLHTRGGIPFFLLALLMAGVVLWAIMKLEKKAARGG